MNHLETIRGEDEGNENLRLPPLKQTIQQLYFCTALFNYDLETIKLKLTPICKKFICGKEICPTTGKVHYQTFISLKKKMRAQQLSKILVSKWISCKGNEESNVTYCSKDKEIYKHGFPIEMEKYVEEIEELYDWEIDIIENILKVPTDKRTIYWFHEPKGCAGKTTFQKYLFTHPEEFPEVIVLGGKASDMKNGLLDYMKTNKKAPKVVLFNIPMSAYNKVSYTGIEEIKDMFFFSGKYEGGMVCHKCPHVLVFANKEPRYNDMALDRWIVKKLYNF